MAIELEDELKTIATSLQMLSTAFYVSKQMCMMFCCSEGPVSYVPFHQLPGEISKQEDSELFKIIIYRRGSVPCETADPLCP